MGENVEGLDQARRYRLLGLIGRGGFGRVYHARLEVDGGFAKDVAIKVIDPDRATPDTLQRFRDEARLLGLLRDRALVSVEPPIQIGDKWMLVMELADGAPLDRLLVNGPLPPRVALEVVGEVARVLGVVHAQVGLDGAPLNLVHRDIKPANVHLTPSGQAKLLDFGIARARFAARESSTTRHIGGTAGYIAPERLQGIEGPLVDVYSLGVMLHELLTGRRPEGPTSQDTYSFDLDAPQDLGPLEQALDLAARMTSPSPDGRPTTREVERTCQDLAVGFGGAGVRDWAELNVPGLVSLEDDGLVGETLTQVGTGGALPSRGRRVPVVVAALAAALVAVAVLAWRSGQNPAPDEAVPAPEVESSITERIVKLGPPGEDMDATLQPGGAILWNDLQHRAWVRTVDGLERTRLLVPGEPEAQVVRRAQSGALVFTTSRQDSVDLVRVGIVDPDGEVRVRREIPLHLWLAAAPDASKAAYLVGGQGLFVLDMATGAEVLLRGSPERLPQVRAAWAPDATRLAVWGDDHIDLYSADGRSHSLLVEARSPGHPLGEGFSLAWPDRDTLYTIELEAQTGAYMLVRYTLSGDRVLGRESLHRFSGSAGLLSVQGERALAAVTSTDSAVYLYERDGGARALVDDGWQNRPMGWLADGRLGILSERLGRGLLVACPPTSCEEPEVLVEDVGPGWIYGGRLWRLKGSELRPEGAEGPAPVVLTEGEVLAGGPSPTLLRRGSHSTTWQVLGSDGSRPEEPSFRIEDTDETMKSAVSPDGQTLAVVMNDDRLLFAGRDGARWEYSFRDLAGSGLPDAVFPTGTRTVLQDLAWLGDGSGVVISGMSVVPPNYRVWRVDLDGRIEQLDGHVTEWINGPSASPAGDQLAWARSSWRRDFVLLEGLPQAPDTQR